MSSSTALTKIRQRLSVQKDSQLKLGAPQEDQSILSRKIGTGPELSPSQKVGVASILPMGFFSYKVILLVFVLMIVFYYIRPYIGHLNDIFTLMKSFMNSSVDMTTPDEKTEKKNSKKIAKKVDGETPTPSSKQPKPDDSASSVQGGAKSGFCLAGEWKGVRTCVKVDNGKDCSSGQLFPSEEKCVNPSMR